MKSDCGSIDSLLHEKNEEYESKLPNCQNNANDSNFTLAANCVLKNYISCDGVDENENHDQMKVTKRKKSSEECSNEDRSKILKIDSPSVETLIVASPVVDESSSLALSGPKDSQIITNDYFSLLPDEVLLFIFKIIQHKPTLVNCACVCQRWKNVAFDDDLWFRIELSQRRIESGVMEIILNKKPIILRMSQTKVVAPIFKNIEEIVDNFQSRIEYLDLSMAAILPNDLESLLRTCHNLHKLSLEFVDVNESICGEVAKNSKLSVLNLAQSGGLNESSLKVILTNCTKLTELHVGWTNLNSSAIKCICQLVPKDIVRLNLSGCVKEMTDNHVGTLVLRCNKLKELDLSDATGITESSIHAICDNLNNLEILSLSRCYNIFPAAYSKLFRLPSIMMINIFGLFSELQIETLRKTSQVKLNKMTFSDIARPTVGCKRTSIWGLKVRD